MRIEVDQLTRDQYRVIHQLRYMRRVRISGSAGSGKTLVAAEKATRLAAGGARVLFLCHNPLLAEHVLQLVAGHGIEVRDFVRWVNELTDTATPQDDDWTHYHEPTQATLDRALEQLASGLGRVDAIVVDEGQDFRPEWWQVVQAGLISHDSGCLYIFHDNNQSLLAHRASYPISEPHVDLSRNCRNAGRVLELMRCFDSSAPEAELGLRVRGRVALRRYEPGGEVEAFGQILADLEREQLLEHTVVITTSDDPLAAIPLVGLEIALAKTGPWQDEVRQQFQRILHAYNPYGVTEPAGGEPWIAAELEGLSSSAVPSAADIELVRRITAAFTIARVARMHVLNPPRYRSAFSWQFHDQGPRLQAPRLRRRVRGPVWAAEVLGHFERDDWAHGLPTPKTVVVQPFHLARTRGVLPLYRVSDFKASKPRSWSS